MNEMANSGTLQSHFKINPPSNETGYKSYEAGSFKFKRDEYFVTISWPKGTHVMKADDFMRALMRDVAWGFFYGTIAFDEVFGTTNHYGIVDMFAGTYHEVFKEAGRDHLEQFRAEELLKVTKDMVTDWTNEGYDPFAAPGEENAGKPWGRKNGENLEAVNRIRVTAERMVGLPGDAVIRTDENGYPQNRMLADVSSDQPLVEAEPGFEKEVAAFNLYDYLSRSDVTWNPSVCSVVKESLFCPTSEEFNLPVEHGNDRCEWFVQLSDEISWDIKDGTSGRPRARVVMKAGDVACMPADIRHSGYSPKRSMLLVWENASPKVPEMIQKGEAPVVAVKF